MPHSLSSRTFFGTATSALAIAAAPAAWADVTAADVWQNLNAAMGGLGLTVSATASQNGNVTTYNDVRYDFSLPMGLGGGSLTSPAVALIENGDGTVTVQYPSDMDMQVTAFLAGQGSFSADLLLRATDATSMQATGTPGDITYTSTSGGMQMSLGDVLVDGQPFDMFSFSADIEGSGTATQRIIEGDLVTISSQVTTGPTKSDMTFTMRDPSATVMGDLLSETLGTTMTLEMSLPAGGSSLLNLAPAFAQGLSVSVAAETLGSNSQQTMSTDLGVLISDQTTISGPSQSSMTLDADGLALVGAIESFVLEIQDQTIPVPINLDTGRIEADYLIPLSARAEPQDFRFRVGLQDLRIGSGLWDMIDPAKQLDRSPADMIIDLSGSTILSADVTNFLDFGMRMDRGEAVATLEDLQLRELELGALGATATATAALTFDNTDWMTMPGMPKPVGGLSFSINGLNAALDQLVALGAMSSDDVFGMRMMMGMVATASGDDGLSGTIQFGEDGSITANGQRLR